MVTRADGHALPVEHLRDVVRVDVVERERDDARAALGRRTEEPDAGDVGERAERVLGQVVLVLLDRLEAHRREVVDGGAEADRLGHGRGARLELVRQVAPRRPVGLHLPDHVAAEHERLHPLEQVGLAPHGADAARRAHLVARDGDEVGADGLDVHGSVRRRLRCVDDDDRAVPVRPLDDALDAVDRAERVRHEVERDDLQARVADELVEPFEHEVALVGERDHPELGARALRDVLPGDEVRVVLELGDERRRPRGRGSRAPTRRRRG